MVRETVKKANKSLYWAIGAILLVLVLAYLFMTWQFSGIDEPAPAPEIPAGDAG